MWAFPLPLNVIESSNKFGIKFFHKLNHAARVGLSAHSPAQVCFRPKEKS
jgi:hypothetical protein